MTDDEWCEKNNRDTTIATLKDIEERINAMETVQTYVLDAKDRARFAALMLANITTLLVTEKYRKNILDRDMSNLGHVVSSLRDFAQGRSLNGLYLYGIPRRAYAAQKV